MTDSVERAEALVPVDPAQAAALARAALAEAGTTGDAQSASSAERVLGLAARRQHRLAAAVGHFRRAIAIAAEAGLRQDAARAMVSLAGALALKGDHPGALLALDEAAPALRGADLGRAFLQRANLLLLQGRTAEALGGYRSALRLLRRAGDRAWEAAVLNNRGLVHAQRGALTAARADLERAEALYVQLGQHHAAAEARQNLGFIAARSGDIQGALRWYERADDYFESEGVVDAIGLRDRCETLLAARLADEAIDTARAAVNALGHRGMASYRAEALLLLAEAHLLSGHAGDARLAADEARRALVRQRRPGWVARAWHVSLAVDRLAGDCTPAMLSRARRAAVALESAGWSVAALDARVAAGRIALDLGRQGIARTELGRAAAARRRGPPELRTRAWHATALLRLSDGDRRGAAAALRAGVNILDRHRAGLGATELRASVSGHAAELAALGVRMAIEDASAERVLAWAERWRAGSLQVRSDSSLVEAELKTLRTGVAASGRAELEAVVRRRARMTPAAPGPRHGAARLPSVERLLAALGERVLVELVEADGFLHGIALRRGAFVLRPLAPAAEVAVEVDAIRSALRRRAYGHQSERSLAAAADELAHAATRFESLVFGPLLEAMGERALSIVPTGPLHALPWSSLPSLRHRPVTVSPSAALWLRSTTTSPADGRGVVLVTGPGLPAAHDEVRELASRYRQSVYLHGEAASVDAVRGAIDGASLAHVAAHGRFRADNPLFSSLRLHDGPLTVYDIEALRRPPDTLVLSACDAGLSAVRPGDELMGLAAALVGAGTRAVVASVVPVPDATTRPFMLSLHDGLKRGLAVDEALVEARAAVVADDEAAAGFVCLGAS